MGTLTVFLEPINGWGWHSTHVASVTGKVGGRDRQIPRSLKAWWTSLWARLWSSWGKVQGHERPCLKWKVKGAWGLTLKTVLSPEGCAAHMYTCRHRHEFVWIHMYSHAYTLWYHLLRKSIWDYLISLANGSPIWLLKITPEGWTWAGQGDSGLGGWLSPNMFDWDSTLPETTAWPQFSCPALALGSFHLHLYWELPM